MKNFTKYIPKKFTKVVYFVLIIIGMLLTIGRWYSIINPNFFIINNEIHSHISNFSLSMITYLGIGYAWLLSGIRYRNIAFLGVALIIGNFLCETLMGFMNTTDIVDALYGTAGVLLVYIFLFFTERYGIIKNK